MPTPRIPDTLSEWSLDTIRELLDARISENGQFDFKEMIPYSGDKEKKGRLMTGCAAFANTNGGLLIFGVMNDTTLTTDERIVGIPTSTNFADTFAPYPSNCVPSIQGTPIHPIPLDSSRNLYVVEIPRSPKRPHAVGSLEGGFRFPYRTETGQTEFMEVWEIRDAFLDAHNRRHIIGQLLAELEGLRPRLTQLRSLHGPNPRVRAPRTHEVPPPPLPIDRIEKLIDLGALLGARTPPLQHASHLQQSIRSINYHLEELRTRYTTIGDAGPKPDHTESHWRPMQWREESEKLMKLQRDAVSEFQSLIKQDMSRATQAEVSVRVELQRLLRD